MGHALGTVRRRRISLILVLSATGLDTLFFGGEPPENLVAKGLQVQNSTVSTPEVATAAWLQSHVKGPSTVQTDLYGHLVLLSQPGSYGLLDEIVPPAVDHASYIYLSSVNLAEEHLAGFGGTMATTSASTNRRWDSSIATFTSCIQRETLASTTKDHVEWLAASPLKSREVQGSNLLSVSSQDKSVKARPDDLKSILLTHASPLARLVEGSLDVGRSLSADCDRWGREHRRTTRAFAARKDAWRSAPSRVAS